MKINTSRLSNEYGAIEELPGDPEAENYTIPEVLPLLPVRDIVIFPYMILPLYIKRSNSILAINEAISKNRLIMLATQKDPDKEDVTAEDLYDIGTVSLIIRTLELPDKRLKILVQGLTKAKILSVKQDLPFLNVKIKRLILKGSDAKVAANKKLELEALSRRVKDQLEQAIELGKHLPPDIMVVARNLDEPGKLADLVSSNIGLKVSEAQNILTILSPLERLRKVSSLLNHEIELLKMQNKIQIEAQDELSRTQREYFLREQLRAIYRELGEVDEKYEESNNFRELVEKSKIPDSIKKEAFKQITRLSKMHTESAEAGIIRTYLEWLTDLPWSINTDENLDLVRAKKLLDEDHYDLETVKERFIEYLAVRKLKSSLKGPILCLIGPPGVGKTSLGKSVARALNRNFVRISLGGVRDEAEIRGHRRTYIAAMPGKIIIGMKQAQSSNPLFMMDEIDKLASDFRGDPASALLEALDPAQNSEFVDHYLGVPFDLSNVMFIVTANERDTIPRALLDRMEIIRLAGYTEEQKVNIAKRYTIPRLITEHGLSSSQLKITDNAISEIIRGYTREPGLRKLEQSIAGIMRKSAKRVALGKDIQSVISPSDLGKFLGVRKFDSSFDFGKQSVGVATGVAWTESGGEIMNIEAALMKGKGKLTLTGKLGEVMQESAQTALSYIRSESAKFNIDDDFIRKYDIHIHAPSGAIPKDGPSAGITIASAILSILTNKPTNKDIAMTGEITLKGSILPVGGLKEKALAAIRFDMKKLIVPYGNKKDLAELPLTIRKNIKFIPLKKAEQVFDHLFKDRSIKEKKSKKKLISVRGKTSARKKELENKVSQL